MQLVIPVIEPPSTIENLAWGAKDVGVNFLGTVKGSLFKPLFYHNPTKLS